MLSDATTKFGSMLSTDQKGAIAELAIAHAALELGVGVSKPLGDQRYDLIFDLGHQFLRVHCKWACRHRDVVIIRCHSARRSADGVLRRLYSSEEVDAFAAYCADVRRCYFLRFDQVPPSGTLQLRLARARNNQKLRVRWAEQYEFPATLAGNRGP
jgi:hypothetical protein